MAICWVLGGQLAQSDKVSIRDLAGITASSAVATALAEAPVLSPTRALIGASGIAMGYLGSLTAIDPDKSWVMILPIPGLPVTTLQLGQAVFVAHVGILAWKGILIRSQLALRGHLAGLLGGYIYGQLISPDRVSKSIEKSKVQWERTFGTAFLAVYSAYLCVRVALSKPFIMRDEYQRLQLMKDKALQAWRDQL